MPGREPRRFIEAFCGLIPWVKQMLAELAQAQQRSAELETQRDRLLAELTQSQRRSDELETQRDRLLVEVAERKTELAERKTELAERKTVIVQLDSIAQMAQENTVRVLSKLAAMEYHEQTDHKGATTSHSGLYLDLLEGVLTGMIYEDVPIRKVWNRGAFDKETRLLGRDWPATALTMIGKVRLRNLRDLLEKAIADGVPGDFIETGVWRGGACVYARAIFAAHGVRNRTVWVADSFCGLPSPDDASFPADAGDPHHTFPELAVSAETVRANFARFGLLDGQVRFLEGWFKDTLAAAPIERLAVLRLDGDMYESTTQALEALYPKVSPDGFVIIDDYLLPACHQAVEDFRRKHEINAPLEEVDGAAVYWRVPRSNLATEDQGKHKND